MAPNPPYTTDEIPGSAKLNAGVYRYDVSTTTVDVVSTTTETSIYSKSVTAGHMSSDRALRLTLVGDLLQNNAGSFTVRVKFGGTTLETLTGVAAGVDSASRRGMRVELMVANRGVANSQWVEGFVRDDRFEAGSTNIDYGFAASSTIDTAGGAQTLEVTVQPNASSANQSFRKQYAVLELVG